MIDRQAFRPVHTALALLLAVQHLYPDDLPSTPGDPPAFDRLVGNGWLREAIARQDSLEAISKLIFSKNAFKIGL